MSLVRLPRVTTVLLKAIMVLLYIVKCLFLNPLGVIVSYVMYVSLNTVVPAAAPPAEVAPSLMK